MGKGRRRISLEGGRFVSLAQSYLLLTALVLAGLSEAYSIEPLKPDVKPVNMTAQDATGVVWSTAPGSPYSLYQWQNDHWVSTLPKLSSVTQALGVWPSPDGGVIVVWNTPTVAHSEIRSFGRRQFSYPVWRKALVWHRGTQYRILGELDDEVPGLHVVSTLPDNVWIIGNSPKIYQLASDGHMHLVYTFPSSVRVPHVPNLFVAYPPLEAMSDGQGRTWFWVSSRWQFVNWTPMRGFVIYDGHSFQYHPSIEGLPESGVTFLGTADSSHLRAGTLGGGLYSIDTLKLTAERIPEPEPGAFSRVTKVFSAGKATYVVAMPSLRPVVETQEHRLSSVLWRLRDGRWQKVLVGIDDASQIGESPQRPWLETPEGLWLGSYAAGLWFIPAQPAATAPVALKPQSSLHPASEPPSAPAPPSSPILINWRQGFPLASVDRIYLLADQRMLAADFQSGRSVAFDAQSLLAPAEPLQTVQVVNPFTAFRPDRQHRLWGLISRSGRALDEWDGEKWSSHPLPASVHPEYLSGVDVDSEGRVWLLPGCREREIGIFDPRDGNWTPYPSYMTALVAQSSHPVRFLNVTYDQMAPIYGPNSQIVYIGACYGVNYFDGTYWRVWNRPQLPGDPAYFLESLAFYDSAGRMAVNIHHETWELGPQTDWRLVSYEPQKSLLVRGFRPSPPGSPPQGCPSTPSTSLVMDRLGRAWWTWQGDLYVGVPGRCRVALAAHEPQPFIDGRLLKRVLIDGRGNAFFETLLARNTLGEYVVFLASGPLPHTTIHLTELSPDSVRADFSTTVSEGALYTWRLDGGPWSVPQSQNHAVFQSLPGGEHTIEAASIDSDVAMDPQPASAKVEIRVAPETQMIGLIARLLSAATDDQREAAVAAIAHQPPSVALPALKAARAQASPENRWWIDAAIQQLEQSPNP